MIAEKGINEVIQTEISSFVSLEAVVKVAEQISLSMLQKQWTFYTPSPTKCFVTSDNPFSFGGQTVLHGHFVGPAHPLVEITIPLRKDLALVVSPAIGMRAANFMVNECSCFVANNDQTALINRRTVGAALQYVYSSENNEEILNLVRSLRGTAQKIVVDEMGINNLRIIENPYKKQRDKRVDWAKR